MGHLLAFVPKQPQFARRSIFVGSGAAILFVFALVFAAGNTKSFIYIAF